MDVSCAVDIVRKDMTTHLSILNQTNIPSRMLLNCDKFDIRHSRLEDGMFESLQSFYNIKLKDCHIKSVSKEAFRGMESLQTLVIEGGMNTHFDKDCLQLPELSNLEVVSFTNTGMISAPNMCNHRNLWLVNLTKNNINSFSETGMLCDTPSNIEVIDISDNYIRSLPERLANVSTKLGRLSAQRNIIHSIEPAIFEELSGLLILNLNENGISSFPTDFLRDNSKMHTLELSHNTVGKIPEGAFAELQDLTLLRLDAMSLTNSVWKELENLGKLQVLFLNKNNIDAFNISVMHRLSNLGILEISENKLTEIPSRTFESQMYMILLNVSLNNIESIEKDSFSGLQSLTSLDIKENQIKYIHTQALSHLISMKVLNMSSNQLKFLPKFPPSLMVLDLRDNNIIKLDNESFIGMTGLLGINIMFNRLTYIPHHTFKTNTNLKLLNLASNNISDIAYKAFGDRSYLETLVLDNNKITDLAFLRFTEFPMLKTIDLSNNKIRALSQGHKLFQGSMEEIFLKGNDINFIEGYTFRTSSKLRYVDLRSNQISMLSNQALEVAPGNLLQVNYLLAGNPFSCDCRLAWLKRFLDLQHDFSHFLYVIRDITSLYCKDPGFRTGAGLMKDVSATSFLCTYDMNCFLPICKCCTEDICPCRHICPDNCTCYRSNNWDDANIVACMNSGLISFPSNISMGTTILDLSGNVLRRIVPGYFDMLSKLRELYLNSSHIQDIVAGSFMRLNKLFILNLGHNMLQNLGPDLFQGLDNLGILNVQSNHISFIEKKSFELLKNLRSLDISGNKLQMMSQYEFGSLSRISEIWMADNPWSCECDYLEDMKNFSLVNVDRLKDFKDISCVTFNSSVEELETFPLADIHLPDFCRNDTIIYNNTRLETVKETLDKTSISAMVSVLTLFVLGMIVLGLVFWNRDFLKVWCFVKFGWKFDRGKNKDDDERPYDAFVSYSSDDEAFVVRELLPHLEDAHEGRQGYRLCVHFRDFPVGGSIAESIIDAVECSRRVIIILSNNFLSSEWCHYEFQTAHHRLLEERKSRIIMILLDEINSNMLDNELRDYLKTRTYVKYGDPWFWPKIEYAMPKLKVIPENSQAADGAVGPDVIPKAHGSFRKGENRDSITSDKTDNLKYIMDNMKNYEYDDPKRYAFEMDVEM